MKHEGISRLAEFIESELQCRFTLERREHAAVFRLPDLPFDLYLDATAPWETGDVPDLRNSIFLFTEQLDRDFPKIGRRLKVLAGHAQRLYARQTVLARIDKRQSMEFQQEHHLQVALPGKYRYGLFHNGELVSIAIFSAGRHMRDLGPDYRSFELIRFCHKSDILVIGGLSKLISGFTADFHPQDIMTYVDRAWSQDSSLKRIGFQEVGIREGGLVWLTADRQIPLTDPNQLASIRLAYPEGYLLPQFGSTKLRLTL